MNKSKINTFIKFLGFIVVLQNSGFGQNAISLDLVQPTFTENCANGSVSLTITGGEAPFDIIWNGTGN